MNEINLSAQWDTYYPKVYGYFFRRVDNKTDVEDLASLVMTDFLQLLSDSEKLARVRSPHAYLWKIAHNYLVEFIARRTKHRLPVSLDDNLERVDREVDSHRSPRYQERIQGLLHCMQKELQDQDYQIVTLSLIDEVPSKEVAVTLKLTAVNVRKRLSRALDKLREQCRKAWIY
jgi:RNA polymerase sigma factor (sigma-70 family)